MAQAVLDRVSATGDARRLACAIEPDFDFLGEEYSILYAAAAATAFQHPLWLDGLYARLAPARGAERIVLTVRDRGELVCVVPLLKRRKSGVTLLETADLGVSDYASPVIMPGWAPPPDLAEAIAALLPAHDILRIRPIREEAAGLWTAVLGGTVERLDFSAHATVLAGSFAEWRNAALDPSFARQLDRKQKKFARTGKAELRLLERPDEIAMAIAAIAMLRAGRFAGDMIQQQSVRDFYTDIAVRGAAAGFARTYSLLLDGEPIGHTFGLTAGGRFDYLLIGCDYDTHGRHSPGLLLYDGMIEDWMRDGGAVFDFTIGDEPFKKDFGTLPTAMFELRDVPTWRGRLAGAAFEAREQFRRLRRGATT